MEQQELFKVDSTELFETLCRPRTLGQGFRMVSKNGGTAGIDGTTIKDYKANLEQEIQKYFEYDLHEEPCTDPYARFCERTAPG